MSETKINSENLLQTIASLKEEDLKSFAQSFRGSNTADYTVLRATLKSIFEFLSGDDLEIENILSSYNTKIEKLDNILRLLSPILLQPEFSYSIEVTKVDSQADFHQVTEVYSQKFTEVNSPNVIKNINFMRDTMRDALKFSQLVDLVDHLLLQCNLYLSKAYAIHLREETNKSNIEESESSSEVLSTKLEKQEFPHAEGDCEKVRVYKDLRSELLAQGVSPEKKAEAFNKKFNENIEILRKHKDHETPIMQRVFKAIKNLLSGGLSLAIGKLMYKAKTCHSFFGQDRGTGIARNMKGMLEGVSTTSCISPKA